MPQKKGLHTTILISALTIITTLPYQTRTEQALLPEISAGHEVATKGQAQFKNDGQQDVWMTIFIHGSITSMLKPPKPVLMLRLIKGNIEGTLYEKAIQTIRNNPFFTKNQPMQRVGLQKIEKNKDSTIPATIIANIFDKLDGWLHGRRSENNLYYTYGWSGIVERNTRYNDTKQFYKDLSQEIRRLNSIGIRPKIRIIGFSHGASLGIDLARVVQEEKPNFTFDVDELILISMPINKTMNPLLHSPMFKKIYNLYSTSDWIQRLDLLAPGGIFTRRLFIPRKKKKIPQKVKQVRIKIMQNKKTKKPFPPGKDPRYQFERPEIISGRSNLLQNMSPLHLEQWFFGWTAKGYRRTFPLYPLPLLSLVPAIISAVDQHKTGVHTADIRPDQKAMIIKGKDTYRVTSMLPDQKDFSELLSLVPQPQPAQITTQEHRRQVQLGIKQAKQKMRGEK